MGKEAEIKTRLFQAIIEDLREHHKDTIDKAYSYFWDEMSPDEFLSGTALELGFVNFEDWLVFDHKVNDQKETSVDVFIKDHKGLTEDEIALLEKIKGSVLSLYEVSSVSKDKRVVLMDLLLSGEYELRDKPLTRGLNKGDIFATRLLLLDGKSVMSGCVFPFRQDLKKKVLGYIDKQFGRYIRNVNPDGTMKDFLKDYGDVFNLAWMHLILDQAEKKD